MALNQERLELLEVERVFVESVETIKNLLADDLHARGEPVLTLSVLVDKLVQERKRLTWTNFLEHAACCPWHYYVCPWIKHSLKFQVLVDLKVFHLLEDGAIIFFLEDRNASVYWVCLSQTRIRSRTLLVKAKDHVTLRADLESVEPLGGVG